MKALVVVIVIMNLFACAAMEPSDVPQKSPDTTNETVKQQEASASDPPKPVKSPHGYIIDKDHELVRFGGFVGDCTDDQNWPYYWQCMSENSGNGGFK